MTEKDERQVEYFRNRILKTERRLRRWARREGLEAYRLYDRDIPEIPLALDRYGLGEETALHLSLYERPYEKDEALEAEWLERMAAAAAEALGLARSAVFTKTRRRQRGLGQYEKLAAQNAEKVVKESGLSFIVNLSDYLDTGLFLDHRPTRAMVRADAAGAEVLNLFAYTGSFSVYAAAGGAKSVASVDLSNTYLSWAGRNLEQNGFSGASYPLVRADAARFLGEARRSGRRWNLIVVDPPTYSNSKMAAGDFNVNRDWSGLLAAASSVLARGGRIYFSSNSRRLKWDGRAVLCPWEDISETTIPPDFRDRKVHRCWRILSP